MHGNPFKSGMKWVRVIVNAVKHEFFSKKTSVFYVSTGARVNTRLVCCRMRPCDRLQRLLVVPR
jgi:hypothetical protein